MFSNHGYNVTQNFREAEALVFTGGADVHPFLYGERELKQTQTDWIRDRTELNLLRRVPSQFPKIGICRGGQFLNVASGGAMWQHVDGHAEGKLHPMRLDGLDKGRMVEVTSTHHQMMIPTAEATVIATAAKSTVKMGDGRPYNKRKPEEVAERFEDTEVVYYEHSNSLCFQPHPEYGVLNNPCQRVFFEIMNEYVQFKQMKG